jgi:hypothetical protein
VEAVTLAEFLLARYDEDEHAAVHIIGGMRRAGKDQAKRRLLELVELRSIVKALDDDPWCHDGGYAYIEFVLRRLAAVYADHPDYREEWRA